MSNGGSRAQTFSNVLEDLEKVRIVIGDLGDAAARCGLTETDLRAAVSFPIATSQLRIVNDAAATLFVGATVVDLDYLNACLAALALEVRLVQTVSMTETGQTKPVDIVLWSGRGVWISNRAGFPRTVGTALEDAAKKFVVDWTLDQQ